MSYLYLNGEVLAEEEARVGANDRGLLLGDGLFESLRAYGGRPFRLGAHLARMRASARVFRLSVPASDEQIADTVASLIQKNACPDAYVRITLTRGALTSGLRLDRAGPPTLLINVRPITPYPAEQYRHGAKLIISALRQGSASPLAQHKTLSYLLYLLARQEATDAGANGALLLNEHGQVTEESVANVFFVREGGLFTPPAHCGLLPGIARAVVMEIAREEGLACHERPIRAGEIFDSEECFLTNSLMEVMPVRSVDRRAIGAAAPGPLTARIADRYRAKVAAETSTPR